MKKMKKLVALILAGVMVMALLTACGGGGGNGGASSDLEAMAVSIVNSARSKDTPTLTNDRTLRTECVDALNHIQNGKIPLKYATQISFDTNTNGVMMLKTIEIMFEEDLSYDANGNTLVTPIPVTKDNVKEAVSDVADVDSEFAQSVADSVTRLGVATRTVDGKTYMAVAYLMEDEE